MTKEQMIERLLKKTGKSANENTRFQSSESGEVHENNNRFKGAVNNAVSSLVGGLGHTGTVSVGGVNVAKILGMMGKAQTTLYPESVQHSPTYVMAVTEYAKMTGNFDVAKFLLESTDPYLTSTKLGVFTLDVSEKLSATPTVGGTFIDAVVLSEADGAVAFFFDKKKEINENTLTRALSEFGEAVLLAKPGDAISEDLTSDLYVIGLTVPAENLADIGMEEDVEIDEETGEPIIDEETLVSDEDAIQIVKQSCFDVIAKSLKSAA